ncbi:MAG: FAD-dependent oxidoreductase [Nitrosomonadales bacterium]|nr:FAD-dependent oxidoreductase [Nitrosomonadales bacterium]
MAKFDYDLLILGGGAAGLVSSKVARGFGKSVAVIEKGKLGGECTNFGCVPSKALIRTAKAVHELKHLGMLGLTTEAPIAISTDGVMRHVRSIVEKVYNTHLPESFKALGIDLSFGDPRFTDNHSVAMDGKTITANKIIIATGSSPLIPAIEGIDRTPCLTNNTVFSLDTLPRSLVVLGGGPIGIELASAFNRLGVETTVVEMSERILFREDRELSDMLAGKMRGEGLNIVTSVKAVKLSGDTSQITLSVEGKDGQRKDLTAQSILIASGRKPNINGLDLEKAGVRYNDNGIEVDEWLRTTADNIYACGDVAGPYRFSHMAEYQAVLACSNAFLPIKRRADYRHAIWSTFTDPELAHAGLTEEEARDAHGDTIDVLRFDYSKIDRARTDIEEFGMSKIILDKNGKIVGAHILGMHASEVLHEIQLAKHFNIPFEHLWQAIHLYPSYSDVIRQPSKYHYAAKMGNNQFIRLLKKIMR